MKLFKQQAYYSGDPEMFFIDRTQSFPTKEDAMRNLESFACRTSNRINNIPYICKVYEVEKQPLKEKTQIDILVERIIL